MSHDFMVIVSIVMGIAGVFMLVGFSADSKKCVVCKNLGPEEYMNHHVGEKGKSTYTHQGCVLKVKG